VGAAPGKALGAARCLLSHLPTVRHVTISADRVEEEIGRFEEARAWALRLVDDLRDETAARIGEFEGKVFESQALMINDPDLVDCTIAYIRENHLAAERAFELHMLEIKVGLLDLGHAMALDRLSDLEDVRLKVLSHLMGRQDTMHWDVEHSEPGIMVADDMTPSQAARLDPDRVLGIITASGSRGSHAVILARAIGIPVIVGLGPELKGIEDGALILMDGGRGTLLLDPSAADVTGFEREMEQRVQRRKRIREVTRRPAETTDGIHIAVQANLDQPDEADTAAALGAEGVGLFRSEFLVIGRRLIPGEDEQYRAYRHVVECFPDHEVTLRTFDIGGDKFPIFLSMPHEENPYLGWRAIRVCLDLPDLFRNQLSAALRASRHGLLRILVPMIATVEEIRRTREILAEVYDQLGMDAESSRVELGAMIETPAALEILDLIAPYVDFVSLGTNDLTQYVIAADRGNARLAHLYDALHPALVRMYGRLARDAERLGLELSACGELAGDPAGVCLLIGLGYRKLSVSLAALPDVEVLIRTVSTTDLAEVCRDLQGLDSGTEVRASLQRYVASLGTHQDALSDGLSVD
jgi:phosphotransferase system enzyme I (PtsI)